MRLSRGDENAPGGPARRLYEALLAQDLDGGSPCAMAVERLWLATIYRQSKIDPEIASRHLTATIGPEAGGSIVRGTGS